LISVFNSTENAIGAGCAVNFIQSDDDTFDDEIIPCAAISDASQTWGIVKSRLDPGEIGSCVISGPVKVKISGSNGDYVQPDINTPGVFVTSSNGVPIVFQHGEEAIINLGGGSGGATAHQFKVIDSSTKNAVGNITQHKVSVVNGHAPDNVIAGYVNNISYSRTDIPLTGSLTNFYIYAINGAIYALNHTYASDLFPVVLLATVDISTSGVMTITQESFADNIIVNVAPNTYGATTLTYAITYNAHSLTVTYSVEASAFINSTPLTLASTTIPANATGKLYAYIMRTTVDPDTQPEAGFAFTVPEGAEFRKSVLEYSLNNSNFTVTARAHDMYFFTFTRLYLNATEAGE
jgi:hypothetical protein